MNCQNSNGADFFKVSSNLDDYKKILENIPPYDTQCEKTATLKISTSSNSNDSTDIANISAMQIAEILFNNSLSKDANAFKAFKCFKVRNETEASAFIFKAREKSVSEYIDFTK